MPHLVLACLVIGVLGLGTGCATSSSAARPSPFPGTLATTRPAPAVTPATGTSAPRRPAVETALGLRGVPYRRGGADPQAGFDCSGFVRYVFAGEWALPRTVAEQFGIGHPIARHAVAPGDLVFFSTVSAGPSHVGIALVNGQFIHAPVSGGVVRVEQLDAAYWRTRFVGARRLR